MLAQVRFYKQKNIDMKTINQKKLSRNAYKYNRRKFKKTTKNFIKELKKHLKKRSKNGDTSFSAEIDADKIYAESYMLAVRWLKRYTDLDITIYENSDVNVHGKKYVNSMNVHIYW
jgi:hypothetical protein